ncbi:hypothetical protein J6590_025930 [Homalodisca vitripennis]|nr:hypothetical protein J6590_025930 [Homalodisca vitripennis]
MTVWISQLKQARQLSAPTAICGVTDLGVPIVEWSKTLDFQYELEIAQVRILSLTVALFISTIDLVLYRLSPLFCLIRSSHRPVAHEDGQNKA